MPEHEVIDGYRQTLPLEVAQYMDNLRWTHEVREIDEVLERKMSRACYEYVKQRPTRNPKHQ